MPLDHASLHRIIEAVTDGWRLSERGEIEGAKEAYRLADAMLPTGTLNPELSILRHNIGSAIGDVVPIPPTEDSVVTFVMPDTAMESDDARDMTVPLIDVAQIERSIRRIIAEYDPRHHRQNIIRDLSHVMVLSTGRCGTVSLLHLFTDSQLLPFHTYWWALAATTRWEMMCRIMAGEVNNHRLSDLWAATRAAEWLGAVGTNRPMIGLNHFDTVFAPVFAAIHREAKFVHLSRDPVAVFESFFAKNQWGETQLRPMFYSFVPGFRFRRTGHDLPECIAWYVHFTSVFSAALGRVVRLDRYLDLSSDKLFAQDHDEIGRLIKFTGAGIPLDEAIQHFATRFNEKAHKATLTSDEMTEPREAFVAALGRLEQTGRL